MNQSNIVIAPSILSADLDRLESLVQTVVKGGADWMHVDVMDGQFVPNLTFGTPVIEALRRITDVPLDVHLMVREPEQYIETFADAGANIFTFHPEATVHVQRHLAAIRTRGMRAGLALNPSTPLSAVEEVVDDLDLLLLMSVNPGFGGQAYIPGTTDKLRRARQLLDSRGSQAYLQVDGGISNSSIATAFRAGATSFVAGSAIFGSPDPAQAVAELRAHCKEGSLV